MVNKLIENYDKLNDKLKGRSKCSAFECAVLCRYLIKLIDNLDIDKSEFNFFYRALISMLDLPRRKCPKYHELRGYNEELNFKSTLKQILVTKLKSLKYKKSSLKNKIEFVSNLYNLDSIEQEIVSFYIFKVINRCVNELHTYFAGFLYEEFEIFGIQMLDLKSWEVARLKKQLFNKGILIKTSFNNDKIALNNKILEVFLNSEIKTQTQIKNILLGKNQKSELCWRDFEHLAKERDVALNILTSAIKNHAKGINILLYGSVGTGKTQFAKLIANKAKCDMYSVSAEFMDKEASRKDRLSDLSSKQTILSKSLNSCLLFDEAEDVMNRGFTEFGSASKAYLNTLIEETPIPIFWTTNNIYDVDPAFLRRMTYTVEFEKLTDDIRLNIWKRVIRKNKFKIDNKKLVELNKNYEIPPSLITNAVKTTKLINGNEDDFEVFVENVAKVVTKKKNVKKTKEFEMKEYNDNLVNTDLDIKDLTAKIKSCGKLNFSLCLYGEPGTGKSLYARYLAKELRVEVIMKRASDLISKYVGETEQNIADAFAQAKSKKAMLIFDEADSFLQNRNNAVRNWEVSQVNEMLTWMESHEYPFVCTTNLLDTLDEASLRRFTFKIRFDFMTKEQVNTAFDHFFGIKNTDVSIKGLTAGDFATVKKKADFLCITDLGELSKMLADEVKVKKSKELQNVVGF